jgi:hypothetical protein
MRKLRPIGEREKQRGIEGKYDGDEEAFRRSDS